jgi:hypothetical protein
LCGFLLVMQSEVNNVFFAVNIACCGYGFTFNDSFAEAFYQDIACIQVAAIEQSYFAVYQGV